MSTFTYTHITKEGEILSVDTMDLNHLLNVIKSKRKFIEEVGIVDTVDLELKLCIKAFEDRTGIANIHLNDH